jgi:hypothetical protein
MLPTIARVGGGVHHGVGDECAGESGKSGGVGRHGTEAVAKMSWWWSFLLLAVPLSDRIRVTVGGVKDGYQ